MVIEIPEAFEGGPDLNALKNTLKSCADHRVIGAFSAISNVTGIVTDVKKITRVLKAHGAISIWDYAGGAPYLPIDMAGPRICRFFHSKLQMCTARSYTNN
jgi:selenocysteine lyase/cysteine desulfurase